MPLVKPLGSAEPWLKNTAVMHYSQHQNIAYMQIPINRHFSYSNML